MDVPEFKVRPLKVFCVLIYFVIIRFKRAENMFSCHHAHNFKHLPQIWIQFRLVGLTVQKCFPKKLFMFIKIHWPTNWITHSLIYQNSYVIPKVLKTWKFAYTRSRFKNEEKIKKYPTFDFEKYWKSGLFSITDDWVETGFYLNSITDLRIHMANTTHWTIKVSLKSKD